MIDARRVARFLLSLTHQPTGAETIELPYEKSLIAAGIGIKPESLSRSFSRLREVGVQAHNGRVVIDDIAALRDYATQRET